MSEDKNLDSDGLSEQELRNKLDLYERFSKEPENSFKLQKLKNKHLKETNDSSEKRSKEAVNYSLGLRTGLPHAPYQQLKYYHEKEDQKQRDNIAREAKEEYKLNSLSKEFDESKSSDEKKVKTTFNKESILKKDRDR